MEEILPFAQDDRWGGLLQKPSQNCTFIKIMLASTFKKASKTHHQHYKPRAMENNDYKALTERLDKMTHYFEGNIINPPMLGHKDAIKRRARDQANNLGLFNLRKMLALLCLNSWPYLVPMTQALIVTEPWLLSFLAVFIGSFLQSVLVQLIGALVATSLLPPSKYVGMIIGAVIQFHHRIPQIILEHFNLMNERQSRNLNTIAYSLLQEMITNEKKEPITRLLLTPIFFILIICLRSFLSLSIIATIMIMSGWVVSLILNHTFELAYLSWKLPKNSFDNVVKTIANHRGKEVLGGRLFADCLTTAGMATLILLDEALNKDNKTIKNIVLYLTHSGLAAHRLIAINVPEDQLDKPNDWNNEETHLIDLWYASHTDTLPFSKCREQGPEFFMKRAFMDPNGKSFEIIYSAEKENRSKPGLMATAVRHLIAGLEINTSTIKTALLESVIIAPR